MKQKLKQIHLKPAKKIFTSYTLYISILFFINVLLTINVQGLNFKHMGLITLIFGLIANLIAGIFMLCKSLFIVQAKAVPLNTFLEQQKGELFSFGRKQKKEWSDFINKK